METPFDTESLILSKLINLFAFRNATTKTLSDVYDEAAVRELIDILKNRIGSVEQLLNALSQPDQPSKCVLIPYSDNEHLQVYGGVERPHVKYCRLWRWPDLDSPHIITPTATCELPYNARQKEFCINPYHYMLKQDVSIPLVRAPYYSESVPINSTYQQMPSNANRYYENMSSNSTMSSVNSPDMLSSCSSSPSVQNENQQTYGVNICDEELYDWGRIAYYEFKSRISGIFQCNTNKIIVDGTTNPHDPSRFCLGNVRNAQWNSSVEQTRKLIGRGLEIRYEGGRIYVENKSNASIFIQSPNSNDYHSLPFDTVHEVLPSFTLCIFNNQYFTQLIANRVYNGVEDVYGLRFMCTIRISFVKGWGAEYFGRDAMSTPCWIEIHHNVAYYWLGKVLFAMDPTWDLSKDALSSAS